jgi:membrane protein implicated in regulation of membrane protease activity
MSGRYQRLGLLGLLGLVFLVLSLAALATGLGSRLAGDLTTSTAVFQVSLLLSLTAVVLLFVRNSRRRPPK